MVSRCTLFLDNESYYPGETINGTLDCSFSSATKIKGIYVTFKGRARTCWSTRNRRYSQKERYLTTTINLLQGNDHVMPAGKHTYVFTYLLPYSAPGTMKKKTGYIKYFATATLDIPWQVTFQSKKEFIVSSIVSNMRFKEPVIKSEETALWFSNGQPITFTVRIPFGGYVASQTISANVNVKNMSHVDTKGLKFKIVQVFEFHAHSYKKKEEKELLKAFKIPDGCVKCGDEKSWNVQLQLPSEIDAPNLEYCNIISVFFEIRGQVLLPFPHMDQFIIIPFSVGHIAVKK